MEVIVVLKNLLSTLQTVDIPGCVVGEIALNYYNVPRVVHDIEICVPESLLPKAVTNICSTGQYELVEKEEYDVFTEYKRGFPVLAPNYSSLQVVIFPDSDYCLAPLGYNIVSHEAESGKVYSPEVLDIIPADEIQHLPMPRLPPYFIGLCRKFLESNDCMARIAVEQLVDEMALGVEWIQLNLGDAPLKVRELTMALVAERSSRDDGVLHLEKTDPVFGSREVEDLRQIPGSGYS